ncbi:hypothetical protein ADL00_27190 [Streptomyces sp. AS58]|uniref:YceI family protein n=1 Tax=Streptomyces TaxID=1883 RepID=UPI0006AFC0C4|nr:YceI family protein [Streptomyces sp. AS58]KOV56944.1 hypothetical protein ADL00_27190 [Streptomyces sp. AS58]
MNAAVETGLWQLDAAASTVAVRHRTMWGMVTVKGVFAAVAGRGEVHADGSATGTLTLDVTSLDTKNAKRDAHLRSADFFDAAGHPEITFAAQEARLGDGDRVDVVGRLTVRGTDKPLTLTARLVEAGAEQVTLESEFTVDRGEFGMTWNRLGMMGGTTAVVATLRFTRAAA